MDRKRAARRALVVYFAVLVVLSAVLEGLIIRTGEPIAKHLGFVFALMWVPAIASVAARIAMREGFGDFSFAAPQRIGRSVGLAWLYPVLVGCLGYGIAWVCGLATFAPPALEVIGVHAGWPVFRFAVLLALALSLGMLYALFWAAGEQIGWTGYMLTRLIDAGCPQPVMISGAIWGVWQVPLILTTQYASSRLPYLSAGLFVVNMITFGYVTALLRLRTGSVFPAILAHASWNATIQGVFDASASAGGIWVGESGALVTLCNAILVAWVVRGRWPLLRTPADAIPCGFWKNGKLSSD
jgi:uncharacterized protein